MAEKILLYCSGVNPSVLEQIDSPPEKQKYAAQGASVLVTSLIATCSGSYALYAVFGTGLVAVPLGLFWGGSILLLDRLMLMTMRKRRNKPLAQMAIAAPRLVLALFVGLTVSKPLELRVFQAEIQQADHISIISTLKEERATLEQAKKNAEADAKEALKTANQLDASVIPAKRASARDYRKAAAQKTREAAQLDKRITEKNNALSTREKINPKEIKLTLLRQVVILEHLAAVEPAVRYTGWVLSTLFVLFEILPIVSKLMAKYSVYDAALENLETTGIRLQEKLREVSVEQIDRESLMVRQYREAIAGMVRDEMIRASQQQVISIVRDIERVPGMAVRQAEMTEAVVDRIAAEIKNAVDTPTNSHQDKAASTWDFSALRRKLENLFWH
ncbi:DUF4407 domain-containing protein [Nostoc sp. ChiQUE01b]|uniref:DUF4407 domain-containing protein n=1 Tax=Nostoc sp. ChiQUE01b TaxID=3075376 RepID=UPI002AD576D1|nr:DUF4407 domain-containing protein [Nostoc sp. ChiQUE01b]MDZ8260608.1 DUF4407 domain-containing protein [Nostoc sp. ChiQUE01b]